MVRISVSVLISDFCFGKYYSNKYYSHRNKRYKVIKSGKNKEGLRCDDFTAIKYYSTILAYKDEDTGVVYIKNCVAHFNKFISVSTSKIIFAIKRFCEDNDIHYEWVNLGDNSNDYDTNTVPWNLSIIIKKSYKYLIKKKMKDNCSICLMNTPSLLVKTKCNHYFHSSCFQSWGQSCKALGNDFLCPLCKAKV